MEVVGAVASIQQLATLLGGTLLKLQKYYSDVKDAPESAKRLRDQLQTASFLTTMVLAALQEDQSRIWLALDNSVLSFLDSARRLHDKLAEPKKLGRVIWPFEKQEIDSLIGRIEHYKADLQLALNIHIK